MHMKNRRVPIGRLIRKLGLSQFTNKGPMRDEPYTAARVTLPLKQHVGAPAVASVKAGDAVKVGDVLGRPPAGQLGVPVHASIAGRVASVGETVVIQAQ
jgi:Na+-translocating ferredoxin:NAD+ oxidoreductase RnfC subunit